MLQIYCLDNIIKLFIVQKTIAYGILLKAYGAIRSSMLESVMYKTF